MHICSTLQKGLGKHRRYVGRQTDLNQKCFFFVRIKLQIFYKKPGEERRSTFFPSTSARTQGNVCGLDEVTDHKAPAFKASLQNAVTS